MAKTLTKREENYSQWYNELVVKADLAENSAVRGAMVIKPLTQCHIEKNSFNKKQKKVKNVSRKPHIFRFS